MFEQITSLENLFLSWREFRRGKMHGSDVLAFNADAEDELLRLHGELRTGTYRHGPYESFYITDPKRRHIHKPAVRDRVVHHGIHRVLAPLFDRPFIYDSFSSRKGKGVHVARNRFHDLAWRLSENNTRTAWVLKCDIRKYFDSVHHATLLDLLAERIRDRRLRALLGAIIDSYASGPRAGIPLGNLTSQLFSNIYLNPFDQFMKRTLRMPYVRYADDFWICASNRKELLDLLPLLTNFLMSNLKLELHPRKVNIRTWAYGIDVLGAISFPHHWILRTKTKRRMAKRLRQQRNRFHAGIISAKEVQQTRASYTALVKHMRGRCLMVVGKPIQ